MTFTQVSTSNENTVCSHLKTFQNIFKRNGRRAHDSNRPHVVWVLQPTHASQICTSIQYGVQLVALSSDLARIEFEFYSEVGRGTRFIVELPVHTDT